MHKVKTEYIPFAGCLIFIMLYFVAANLYPGGTRWDESAIGYSHISNFWCDLLDEFAYNGELNKSNWITKCNTILLPISLIFFFWNLPILFTKERKNLLVIKYLGVVLMVLASFMIYAHDLIINSVVIGGIVGSVLLLWNLIIERKVGMLLLSLIPLSLGLANYIMWLKFPLNLYMPLIQKLAILSSLIWILMINFKIVLKIKMSNKDSSL